MPTMNAVVIDQYGPPEVLQYKLIERPTISPGEVLVRIHATSVNPVDCSVRRGDLKLFVRMKLPAVLGIDVSGVIAEVGSEVKDLHAGDEVWGFLRLDHAGAYAEYAAADPAWLRPKPRNLSHLEAAAISGAGETAIQGLRNEAKLQAGQRMLLIGASGGVGSLALQIAKAMGAEVTAVCGTRNVELVKSLGATRVIDYQTQDVFSDGTRYDVVYDCVGQHSFWEYKKLLREKGTHVVVPASPKHMINAAISKLNPHASSHFFFASPSGQDLDFIREHVEAGRVRPVIDRTYSLAEIAQGHHYSETGRTVGKIAIAVG